MSETFPNYVIRKGDTLPKLEYTLEDVDDDHATLTGATVKFIYRVPGVGQTAVVRNAVVTSATTNEVEYSLVAGDVAAIGYFLCEWEVTYSDGKKHSFPPSGFQVMQIVEDLGG